MVDKQRAIHTEPWAGQSGKRSQDWGRQKTVKVQAIKSRVNKVGTRQQGIVNYLNNQKSDTGNQNSGINAQ